MTERYRRYKLKRFEDWKRRVANRLPDVVKQFYALNSVHYNDHVLLGSVIKNINDPYYGIMEDGKRLNDIERLAADVCLRISVEKLFSLVNSRI